jgi:spore maturation protein CgeB
VVDYQFLSCGDVFTQGLAHAAQELGLVYAHAESRDPNLATLVQRFAPDLLLVVHGRIATPRLGPLVSTLPSGIWLLDEPYEVDDCEVTAKHFDHVFVNDSATLDRYDGRATYLPVAYDPQVHTPGAGGRPYAVGFIGGGNRTRDRYLAALARAGHLSYVIGGAWGSPEVNRLCVSKNVAPRETAARYQHTRIVLNVFREVHHYNREGIAATSLNPRVYEALACGALVVSEWRPEADRLLPEMPTFRSERECVGLVADLLAHPEEAESHRRACADRIRPHTYRARLETMLEVCGVAMPAERVA